MKQAYLVAPMRSPVGKAFRGGLARKRPDELCADVIAAVLKKSGLAELSLIDDVIVGCAMPEAEQGMNVARFALLLAGLPQSVPGMTINRFCSSGLQTIATAASLVQAGHGDCYLAGGTESMTLVPMMGHKVVASRVTMSTHPEYYLGMGHTAENVARDYKISRERQDQFSYESHMKAAKAISSGAFDEEIIPIKTVSRRPMPLGEVAVKEDLFKMDDGPRAETSLEALAALKPAFMQGGSVTAGNSSQMSDGAAMVMVCSEAFVKQHNLTPMGRFVSFSVAGVAPEVMGIGPVAAIPKALKQGGLTLKDIERIELNEAFAAQSLAVIDQLALDVSKVNPTGGAIALGHPLGATGAKLTATLLHGLKRDKQRYGMVTMCIGTGMGACGIFERL